MTMSSPISPPSSITFLARTPSSVPSRTAARSMSPVEMCGTTKWRDSRTHCVPLPAPWRPRMMSRAPGIIPVSPRPPADGEASLQEAFVVAHHQLSVDLADELHPDTDGDQHRRAREREALDIEHPEDQVRHDRDHGDEQRARQGDPVDSLGQVPLGLRTGTDTGDEPALTTDLVGLLD